jgi:hypothetical protein
MFGLGWGKWVQAGEKPLVVEWWRSDADLLANTHDTTALPVGSTEVTRHCTIEGEGVPLARLEGQVPLLMRSSAQTDGGVYFLGTLPGSGSSSLARDGVVMFAMLHRALEQGAGTLGKAQQAYAAKSVLGSGLSSWEQVDPKAAKVISMNLPLVGGVVASEERLIALNRPPGEDDGQRISTTGVNELFAGLDFRVLTDTLGDSRSLTSEIWRTFLIAMALAIVGEALLCMPPRREATVAAPSFRPANRERENQPMETAA